MKHDWHEFLNTTDELHAFAIGFFEVLCPWPPRYQDPLQWPAGLKQEYHYYTLGRGIAVIAWIIIAKIIQELFF